MTVTVPPGATALVHLPDPSFTPVDVGPGQHSFACPFPGPDSDEPAGSGAALSLL